MALTVNSNIQALNAYRNLNKTQTALSGSLEKLSSGLRINRAADDAAGLSISESLKSQINGLSQASRNAQDGISLVQTADGALTQTQAILQRLRVLAVQSANGTQSEDSRTSINTEATSLKSELTRIASTTAFNGIPLLDGTFTSKFQVGKDSSTVNADNQIEVTIATNFKADGDLAVDGIDLSGADGTNADAALDVITTAINTVSAKRAELGAVQNRFQYTVDNLDTTVENLSAAQSRILDTDMASEMVNFTRAQILSQAGTSMLAQAKSLPSSVLELLKG